MNKNYPGWTLASIAGLDLSCYDADTKAHPSLARGDYNGDGRTDFAVELVHNGSLYALEFLSNATSYTSVVLFKRPVGKRFGGALITEKKGKPNSVGTVESVDTLAVSDCGSVPARYVFRSGRVRNESPRD